MTKLITSLFISCIFTFNVSAQNYRVWATYYGGTGDDFGYNVTTDAAGNVYMVGQTESAGMATNGTHQTTIAGMEDGFIVKFNSAGVRQWATYFGGSDDDFANDVKVDASGNVYITGYTRSPDGIATPGAYDTWFSNGVADAFLMKFNSSGVRVWGTYIGGSGFDDGNTLVLDASGNIYVGGNTLSPDSIATAGTYQPVAGGSTDGFLQKYNSAGVLQWGTYFGGTDQDAINGIALDNSGNIYAGGFSGSLTGIANGGWLNTNQGGLDGIVAKFDNTGNIIWSTYYGGAGNDPGQRVAVGPGGVVYLNGMTNSLSGIASGGHQSSFGGNQDGYLVKFNSAGTFQWGTYYGGTDAEEGWGLTTDAAGNVYFTGDTYSNNGVNIISTPSGFQTNRGGEENCFLVVFNAAGTRLKATYYGAQHEEDSRVTVSPLGDIYVGGYSMCTSGAVASMGFQNSFGGGVWDAYLVKFNSIIPHEDVIVPNDSVPPVISTSPVIPPKKWWTIEFYNGGNVALSNAIFKNFSPGGPLPSSGSSTFNFTCDFTGYYNTGSASIPVSCVAHVKMKAVFDSSSGGTRYYDTEMLQLDLSGGTLPAGVMFRESPTLQSTGMTVITDKGAGLFGMSSFFDVFTELSTDGGTSWTPGNDPHAFLVLQDVTTAAVPTLSQWGLIALGLLVLSFGVFNIKTES